MEQLVRVKKAYPDGTAEVIHIRESACSGDCHKCSGCGAAKETIVFRAENPIGAKAGDRVTVQSRSGPVLKAAVAVYLLPLALFFGGYAVGAALGVSGALVGGLAFALSILLIAGYDRRVAKKDTTVYTITGLAEEAPFRPMKKGDNDRG